MSFVTINRRNKKNEEKPKKIVSKVSSDSESNDDAFEKCIIYHF
jgi:hypothetical protein